MAKKAARKGAKNQHRTRADKIWRSKSGRGRIIKRLTEIKDGDSKIMVTSPEGLSPGGAMRSLFPNEHASVRSYLVRSAVEGGVLQEIRREGARRVSSYVFVGEGGAPRKDPAPMKRTRRQKTTAPTDLESMTLTDLRMAIPAAVFLPDLDEGFHGMTLAEFRRTLDLAKKLPKS